MIVFAALLCISADLHLQGPETFSKDARDRLAAATVFVVNGTTGLGGSGALLKRNGPVVYLLTANHVVDGAKQLEITTFTAGPRPRPASVYDTAEVIAQSAAADLAVVRWTTRDAMPGFVPVCPPSQLPGEKGFAALSCGCKPGEAPESIVEDVQGKRKVRRPGATDSVLCWETARAPEKGRSGGPLIDRHGYLIGLDSGAGGGKGYYTHGEEIGTFFRRHGLGWLIEEKPEP